MKTTICAVGAFLFAVGISFGEFAPLEGGASPTATAARQLATRHPSLVTGAGGLAASPYGVCAHLNRIAEARDRAEECRKIAEAGIGLVRFDFEWWRIQKGPGVPFDFSLYDACMADAEAAGLTVLPIIYGNPVPMWARPVWEHLDEWGRYVEAVVSRYGERFPDVEIWNEQNLEGFWHHPRDPAKYTEALKVAYEAAKRANPGVRVFLGGLSGIPMGYIEGIYKAGGGPFFDAMNVHPYNHPRPPEGDLDVRLEELRALMAKYGDAEKPVVITEHGWPTHRACIGSINVLLAGLKVAKPGQKAWRAVYAATTPDPDGEPPRDVAEALEEALPPGSTAEACFGKRLRERLAAGDVDLVVYPFDESFPVDTFGEVRAFVEKGGVLAVLGGMPLWFPMRETAPGAFQGPSGVTGGASAPNRMALKIDVSAWWIDDALPRNALDNRDRAFPTEAAKAAGFKGDPAGEPGALRFQTPKLLEEGDEFIPLLTVKDANGRDAAAASVTRFADGGGLILSGLSGRGVAGSAGEAGQARFLPRALAIAFAEGVEQFYWYNFRSREDDPAYSEHHFGLVHSNRTPKPALGAYSNFILARPPGSVQSPGPWHDESRKFFFPQWTRPDGTKVGLLWTTGPAEKKVLKFDAEKIVFRTYTGLKLAPARVAPDTYRVPVSGDPVFFEGGRLILDDIPKAYPNP